MRENIEPIWEDDHNKEGVVGHLKFKIKSCKSYGKIYH